MEKQQIIDSAFSIWQDRMFTQTSLTPLARDLGVTKAAIYRHFPDKASLKRAMEESFAARYREASAGFSLWKRDVPLEERLTAYARELLGFLAATPGCIVYMTNLLFHRRDRESLAFWPLLVAEGELILKALMRQGLDAAAAEEAIRYFYTHLLGWAVFSLKEGKSAEGIAAEAPQIVAAFLGGYCRDRYEVDYAAVEREIVVRPGDLPEENIILRSLLKVVAAEGLPKATISRIAEEAGYSKSTLYSFFKNKKDMLYRIFSDHAAAADALYRRFCPETAPLSERTYRLMVVLYRYLRRNRAFLVTLDWMRFQNLHLGPDEQRRWRHNLPGFVALLDTAECRDYGLDSTRLFGLLWLQLIREIVAICRPENLVEDGGHEDNEHLRTLHRLYCGGIQRAGNGNT